MPRKKGRNPKPGNKKNPSKRDAITGNWQTEDGLLLQADITSGSTSYKTYFLAAEKIINVTTATYQSYGDVDGNRVFDPAVDKPLGSATISSKDEVPYYSGTFSYRNGT